MKNRKILFVLTNHDRLGTSDDESAEKTGFHLSEAADPWQILTQAGFTIDLATPEGGKAPVDPSSCDLEPEANRAFYTEARQSELESTRALKDVNLAEYSAIYFPGGHGTMWDLPDHPDVQSAVRTMYESGRVVAAVCHGPAALVNVRLSNGNWLVDGKTLSVFTDAEERAVEKAETVPFLLASTLEDRGATLDSADNFEAAVTCDGRLVTGQNPASAPALGRAIRNAVAQRQERAA